MQPTPHFSSLFTTSSHKTSETLSTRSALLPTHGSPSHITEADLLALAGCVFDKALVSPRQPQAAPLTQKPEISYSALQFLFSSPVIQSQVLGLPFQFSVTSSALERSQEQTGAQKSLWHYSGHFRINFIPASYLKISIVSPHHQWPYSIN